MASTLLGTVKTCFGPKGDRWLIGSYSIPEAG